MNNSGLIPHLGRAAAARLITLPITVGAGLLTSWAAVGYAGSDVYGAVLLITGFVQLLPFADLGTGAAVMSAMSDHTKSHPDRLRVLVAAQRVLLGGAVLIGAASVALLVLNLWPPLLGPAAMNALPSAPIAASAFLLTFAFALVTQAGTRILIGRSRNHQAILLSTTGPLTSLILVIVCAALGAPYALLTIAPALGMLVSGTLTLGVSLSGTPITVASVFRNAFAFRTYRAVKIVGTATPMLIISLGLAVTFQADKLVLSHFGTSAQLAEFGVANQLYSQAWAAVASVLVALWAVFNGSRSTSNRGEEFTLYRRLLARLAIVGLPVTIAFSVALWLLSGWVSHGESMASIPLTTALGLLFYFQIVHYPAGSFLTTEKGLRFQAYCIIPMTLCAIPLSVVGVLFLGAAGPAWASTICIVVFQMVPAIWYISILHRRKIARESE